MNNFLSKYYTEDTRKYLFIVLAFSALLLSVNYMYLIKSSIMNAVVREQNDKEISQLVIKISGLENKYMAKKSDLNIDMAYSLGFKDDFSKVHFSSEDVNIGGNLSLLGDEI